MNKSDGRLRYAFWKKPGQRPVLTKKVKLKLMNKMTKILIKMQN